MMSLNSAGFTSLSCAAALAVATIVAIPVNAGTTINDAQTKTTDWSDSQWVDIASGDNKTASLTDNYSGTVTVGNLDVGRKGKNAKATFTQNAGTVNLSGDFVVGFQDALTATAVLNAGSLNVSGDIYMAKQNGSPNPTLTVNGGALTGGTGSGKKFYLRKGAVTVDSGTVTMGNDFCMGEYGAATLTLNGGTMSVATWTRFENTTHAKTINLNGGELTTATISNHGGSGAMTVNFNGGTLKNRYVNSQHGLIDSGITVNVKANGGTIDAGTHDIVIGTAMSEDSSSTGGGMKFIGGGSVTLSGAVGWTGGTTIEPGTKVIVDSAAKKDAILGSGLNTLKVLAPSATGTYTILEITGGDTLAATDLSKVALASGAAGSVAFSLSNDGTQLLATFTYAGGAISQSAPTLVFPGASLADLATHTLRARMQGTYFDAHGVETTFFNRQETLDGDDLVTVTYQLQAIDDNSSSHYTKAVKVEFTADASGVYARIADGNYSNYGTPSQFGTDPLTTNPGTGSYIPYDFRMVAPANAISVNIDPTGRNNAGNTLDTTSSVRYGAGDYAVPYSAWSNFQLPSNGNTQNATIGGATVTIANHQGNYLCSNMSATKDVRHGYIDDSASKPNPKITITNIPYEFYRIVVYMSGDGGNKQFGYLTMNGQDYTASGDARSSDAVTTVKGTANWGWTSQANTYLYGLQEGRNYLVSDVFSDSTATIVGHRISADVRTGIGAFQIVEYVPTTYTATISDGGAKSLSALSWDNPLPALLTAKDKVVVNVNEDTTLDIDIPVDVYGITFNVADGKTLTLAGGSVAAQYVTATGAGQTVVASASQLSGTVKGDGTLVYGAAPAGLTLTQSDWSGVLWLKNCAIAGVVPSTLAGANSTLRLTGVTGFFNDGNNTSICEGTLELVDDGATAAFTVDGGWSDGGVSVFARLSGNGTLGASTSNISQRYVFMDVSAFGGTINCERSDAPGSAYLRVIIGDGATLDPEPGTITVASSATAAISSGKTWTANGMVVDGTIDLGYGANAPKVLGGTGTLTALSGAATVNGYDSSALLTLTTAPGATLVVADAGLVSMTIPALSNLGTLDFTGTALTELTLSLASGVTAPTTGTILYPATFEKFVVSPADQTPHSLAAYTTLPTLPAGASYYVTVAETREEFGKGEMTVTDAAASVNVRVARPDGTFVDVVPVDGTATLTEAAQIAGAATAFDATYTNTVAYAYRAPGWNAGNGVDVANPQYNNTDNDETTGMYILHHPWVSGVQQQLNALADFSLVVVGTMSPSHNTQFIHMGNSYAATNQGILITTTENDDEVLIAKNTGATVDAANGVRASVPNAATARHAYVINKKGSLFEVWVDGVKRGQFDAGEGFALGSSDNCGVQVGSDHGGKIRGAGIYQAVANAPTTETGVVNLVRLFDYSISDAQAEAVFNAYPYVSQGGLYTREVAADGTFSQSGAWEKEGEAGTTYAVPTGATVDDVYYNYNPSATLTVNAAAELQVNADVSIETLTVGGTAPVKFAYDGTHTVTVVGAAIVNSPVTNEYGAVYLAGAPVQLGSSGSICFDCSGVDVSKVYAVTRFQLTGLTDRADEKFTLIPPTDPDRSYAISYNTTGSCYDFVVTPLHNYVVANNMVTASPTMATDNIIVGAGGLNIETLTIPDNATVLYDPIKTPFYVWGTSEGSLSIGEGVKFKLTPNYANMTLGRVVLFAYKAEYVTGLPENLNTLLDPTSIAPNATYTITSEDVPDDTPYRKQLVLTVGDYANDAKEIRLTCIGDSITQGTTPTIAGKAYSSGIAAQYRTSIAARLAANGYRPKMLGVWKCNRDDGARVQQSADWIWHSGISGDRIRTGGTNGGVRDNLHVYLDVAGKVDALTLLIGTNDIGAGDTAEDTYAAYTNLVFDIARLRPATKIIGSTILDRNGAESENHAKVVAFNALLAADCAANRLPANYVMLDLFSEVPLTSGSDGNFCDDLLHPTWIGHSAIAEGFAAGITNALPFASYAGPIEDEATDAAQSALGVAGVAATAEGAGLAAYTNGMVHVFTIDPPGANNVLAGSSPYTATNTVTALNRPVTKAGYFMELVRNGTSRHRWVWVDFDAAGKTLDEIDFPWTGANVDLVVNDLHVLSNDGSIHNVAANVSGVKGAIEGTRFNYLVGDDNENVPADLNGYGWNDTLESSGTYGCFQAHRIFGEGEHWNGGEVLFAWNRWGAANSDNDQVGIGTFFYSGALGSSSGNSADYTFTSSAANGAADTITAAGYQVVHFEIWAALDGEPRHGVWCGAGMDGNFDNVANWEDGRVPAAGEDIDLSAIPAATTISVTGASAGRAFGTATMGANVVTFLGNVKFTGITDTSKIAVGANATVTLDGDLEFSDGEAKANHYIVNTVAAGGRFIVTGDIVAQSDFLGYIYQCPSAAGGAVQARGVINNATSNSDSWAFRLNAQNAGTAFWIVGDHGFGGSRNFWTNGSRDVEIQPLDSDFDISSRVGDCSAIMFNTTGVDGNAHVIAFKDGGDLSNVGAVTIAGAGRLVVDAVNTLSGAVTVTNTATLAVLPGKKMTSGAISVASGATLEVPESGTVTLAGGLTLADGAILGFNFTDKATAPVLAVATSATLPEGGTVNVKVTGANGVRPSSKHNPYVLTSGGGFTGANLSCGAGSADWVKEIGVNADGNIVLTVKSIGICIFIR